MKVNLETIIDAIEMASDSSNGYLNLNTMETVWLSDYFDSKENEELAMKIDNHPDQYLCLPSQYDIYEYSIMEDFIDSLADTAIQNKLYRAIRGKGAFRKFKDEICYLGIREEWFAFQHNAYVEIAKKWCKDNQFEYLE